jgi:hypothetical protein
MTNKPTSGRRQRRVHSPEFKAKGHLELPDF